MSELKRSIKILQLNTDNDNSLDALNQDIGVLVKKYEDVTVHFDSSKIIGNILIIPIDYVEEFKDEC